MADEHAEARFVAAEIERMVDEGVSRAEIAVFYRTNAQSRVLEDMLVRAQIGYQVIGGTKFYERAEIRDAIAYLTFLVNPQDANAFTRIANSPRRGLGQTSLSRVLSHADTMGIPVWEAAAEPGSVPGLGTAAQKALAPLHVDDGAAARAGGGRGAGRRACSTRCCARPATWTRWRPSARSRRRAGSRTSRSWCGSRASTTRPPRTAARSASSCSRSRCSPTPTTAQDDDGLVTLMTMHNAKGLEYPIVFMIGMEDGVFPHSRALDEGGLEEERRLAYVGITRAMRDLTLTYARRRNAFGANSFGVRSRFIDEIPRELTDQPERERAGLPTGRVASLGGRGRRVGRGERHVRRRGRRRRPGVPHRRRRRPRLVRRGRGDRRPSPAGSSSCASPSDGSERKLMADYAPVRKR